MNLDDELEKIIDDFIDWYEAGLKPYPEIRKEAISALKDLFRKCVPEEKNEDDLRVLTWAEILSHNNCRSQTLKNIDGEERTER